MDYEQQQQAFSFENQSTKIAFLAGICPQFWSHVPMTIQDFYHLQVIDGIYCMDLGTQQHPCVSPVSQPCVSSESEVSFISTSNVSKGVYDNEDDALESKDIDSLLYNRFAPVSKCLLVGTIVYADVRRDGTMAYVLDDGTGLVDCVHWSTSDQQQDIYSLPNLQSDENVDQVQDTFAVGDSVRVFGKLECLGRVASASCNRDRNEKGRTKLWIGEIQAAIIESIQDDVVSAEAGHWKRCLATIPKSIQYWLDLLGPQIRAQVHRKASLPAADDILGQWRVFGSSCQCQVSYKESLLYCHCQATLEPLDPYLKFRDSLLERLLDLQEREGKMLVFPYKDIKTFPQLRDMAFTVAENAGNATKYIVDQLFRKTFRALRKDGIVYLMNGNTDDYLLITRDHVLEPFVRKQMTINEDDEKHQSKNKRSFVCFNGAPPHISKTAHMERLRYIHRLCNRLG
jgi:hypothetical protein